MSILCKVIYTNDLELLPSTASFINPEDKGSTELYRTLTLAVDYFKLVYYLKVIEIAVLYDLILFRFESHSHQIKISLGPLKTPEIKVYILITKGCTGNAN